MSEEGQALAGDADEGIELSEAHVAAFRDDGCVAVPGLFDDAAMDRIEAWTDEVAAMPEVPGRQMVYYEDDLRRPGHRVLNRIENFSPYHPGFDALFNGPRVLGCLERLLGEPAVLFKEKINFKLPGGDGFKAHQDVQAGWDRYAALHVTMLVSIDDADASNGCLELAPGLHRQGLIGEMWAPLDEDDPAVHYRACPTRRGDAVFFDSFAPHRSGPNRSRRPRRVLYITYNRASEGDHRERYYADKRASYPPECERAPGQTYKFKV